MAKVTAKLSNYRQSPRKVRLVADLVRGKKVDEAALHELGFLQSEQAIRLRSSLNQPWQMLNLNIDKKIL
jgi:ribosomal protein L22